MPSRSNVRSFFILALIIHSSQILFCSFQRLATTIKDHFARLPDEKYEELFNSGIAMLRERAQLLEIQVAKVRANRDKCRNLVRKMEQSSL